MDQINQERFINYKDKRREEHGEGFHCVLQTYDKFTNSIIEKYIVTKGNEAPYVIMVHIVENGDFFIFNLDDNKEAVK